MTDLSVEEFKEDIDVDTGEYFGGISFLNAVKSVAKYLIIKLSIFLGGNIGEWFKPRK